MSSFIEICQNCGKTFYQPLDRCCYCGSSILLHTIGIGGNGIIPLAAMILTLLNILEGVLILRNSSRKFKTVVDNANLLNYTVSS